jgi:WD40 repeat protein
MFPANPTPPPPCPAVGKVTCVKVYAKGTQAISASRDHTLRFWNLLSGQEKFSTWDGGSASSADPQLCSLHVDEANRAVYSVSGSKVVNNPLCVCTETQRAACKDGGTWGKPGCPPPDRCWKVLNFTGGLHGFHYISSDCKI